MGKAADMLRADLEAAGLPVEVDGPEGTETRDFHALRVVFISNVIRAGADLKQAMTLARHSDPRLTTARYGRTRLHDLGAVVAAVDAELSFDQVGWGRADPDAPDEHARRGATGGSVRVDDLARALGCGQ